MSFVLMALVLALIACNTENDGVFKRISESVEREVVGAVTLIMFDENDENDENNDLIAHTKIEGIMTYDLSDKKWIPLIDQEHDLAVLGARRTDIKNNMLASTGTTLYFATAASNTYNNSLFEYDFSVPTTIPYVAGDFNENYQIKAMTPQADLMVVYDDVSEKFNVYKPSEVMGGGIITPLLDTDLDFAYEQINLLAIDDDTFLITGYDDGDNETYNHVFYEESEQTTNLNTLSSSSMIVAMYKSGSHYVFIANNGKVYYGDNLDELGEGSTLPLPDTNMAFRTLPILSPDGTDVYVQGANKRIYEIDPSNGSVTDVSSDFDSDITNVEIHSFLSDGTNHYVGTKGHGIMEVGFPL